MPASVNYFRRYNNIEDHKILRKEVGNLQGVTNSVNHRYIYSGRTQVLYKAHVLYCALF